MLTFVIIPIIAKFGQLDNLIYLSSLDYDIILYNFICISLFQVVSTSSFFFKKARRPSIYRPHLIYYSSFILLSWLILYLLSGGLMYRENDGNLGYESRSILLKIILALYNVVIVIALSIIIRIKKARNTGKIIGGSSILFFLIVIVLSGSRGIIIQLILSAVFLFLLDKKSFSSLFNIFTAFFTFKNVLAFAILIFGFGLIGYIRDDQSDFKFQLIYRLSEPYWHMALNFSKRFGGDISVLYDSFDRIYHIISTHFGHTIDGSIEGSDYYIAKYAGIDFVEGTSLPITLFGFGFLIHPYFGVPLILILTTLLIRFSFMVNIVFSKKILWGKEFLICFTTSCLLIYSKSYSGVFQILLYEKFTAFIVLFILSQSRLILKRN